MEGWQERKEGCVGQQGEHGLDNMVKSDGCLYYILSS